MYLLRTSRRMLLLAALICSTVVAKADGISFKIIDGISDDALKTRIEQNTVNFLETLTAASDLRQKSVKFDKQRVLPEASKTLNEMWKTSALCPPQMDMKARLLSTKDGFEVRGIPVDFLSADSAETRQELTLSFAADGRVSNVAISMDIHRYEDIMNLHESDLDYRRRQVIVNFVEEFRTAYNRKDLSFLNQVYSDKALIITGKVIKEKPNTDQPNLTLANNKVVYTRQTKQEYLQKLSGVFKRNKFINVKFDDIEVLQHPTHKDIYGVTLKQHWHAGTYSDVGWLFLLVDFRDENFPLIQVRTWQPEKDALGNTVITRKDVFHVTSFQIKRF